ncbi:unnamed protein product [Tetraodon nigroviridis]|uniref:Chromosome 6 SCAF14544, whole genome shotgun sequence n=1 Tax=Tetraodon nigroviridis TaxID=99883 RepID=Q4SMZ6_TETNG|nr:unnamed protein product [Tetraodon nigroviridis]
MGLTIWLSVLCLQASLLTHALDCSGATRGEVCVSGETADGQVSDAPIMDVVVKGRPAVTKGFIYRDQASPELGKCTLSV